MVSSHFAALFRCNRHDCCSPQGQLWDLEGLFIQVFPGNFSPQEAVIRNSEKGGSLLDTLPVLSLFCAGTWSGVKCVINI